MLPRTSRSTWRVDLHTHTHWSSDSLTSYPALTKVCHAQNIDVLAITDHNQIEGAQEFAQRGLMPIIVGEEINSTEGEIIGLFLTELIPRGLSPEETVSEIRRQGGIVYVPHPFDRVRRNVIRRDALLRIADRIDVLETLNSRIHIPSDNISAIRFAKERKLPQGGGSDAHIASEVGKAGVEMRSFADAETFRQSMATATVFGASSSPMVHLASSYAKYRKRYIDRLLPRSTR